MSTSTNKRLDVIGNSDNILYKPNKIIIKKISESNFILYDPNSPNWISVNEMGKDLINILDNDKTVIDILDEYLGHDGTTEHKQDIIDFLNEVLNTGFISKEPLVYIEPEIPVNLQEVWLHLTNDCNLRCLHCHLESGVSLVNELTLDEIYHLIDDLVILNVKNLFFTGGEPTIRSDFLNIIKYAIGKFTNVHLLTNGILINDSMISVLNNPSVTIQVSLDGAKQTTHEKIRGIGTYYPTINNIKKLLKNNCIVGISMTINKLNIDEIKSFIELGNSLKVNYIHFPAIQIKGRAEKNKHLLEISIDKKIEAYKFILMHKNIIPITYQNKCDALLYSMHKRIFCAAGASTISIAANGDVFPCSGLHYNPLLAGNIRETNIENIFNNSKLFLTMRNMSLSEIEECNACEFKYVCGSGCYINKWIANSDLYTKDPFCRFYKDIYWQRLMEIANNASLEDL